MITEPGVIFTTCQLFVWLKDLSLIKVRKPEQREPREPEPQAAGELWFMLMLWICINPDMLLLLYRRGPFCLWPTPSGPPRLHSQAVFTTRVVTGQGSFCRVLSPRQKTALWGTTGIHKYSSPEKFIEFVVKDLWWTAEVVMEKKWGGGLGSPPPGRGCTPGRCWCWEIEASVTIHCCKHHTPPVWK